MDTTSIMRVSEDVETPIQLLPNEKAAFGCCTCGKNDVKYRCPRCERITCSLQCCVGHKKQFDCNGKRDRTKFVQLKQFTDADLSNDYFFLEEISRSTNSAARSRSQLNVNARRYTNNKKRKAASNNHLNTKSSLGYINPDVPSDWLVRFPVTVQLFAEHSAKRGIALTLLAPGMSKRTRNSSYFDKKKDTLYWRVEWEFPSATVPVSHCEERADEKTSLFALLREYLMPTPENVAIRGKLKKYAVPDWDKQILLLLRKEFTPASQLEYYRLNGNESLDSNLKRKAVVEFPVITVVLVANADQYPMAHDVIETIFMNANDQQAATEEPEAMKIQEKETSCKMSTKLLTGEDRRSVVNECVSVMQEGSKQVETLSKHKTSLIEELQVAQTMLTNDDCAITSNEE